MAVELELWACLGKQGGIMTVIVDKTVTRMRNFKLKKTVTVEKDQALATGKCSVETCWRQRADGM